MPPTEQSQTPQPYQNSELFGISLQRLIVLSVLTGGFYDLYWFYRNWKGLMPTDPSIKHPVWRALFTLFYLVSLCRRIANLAASKGEVIKYNPTALAIFYLLIGLVGNALHNVITKNLLLTAFIFIVSSLAFVVLLPVQRSVLFVTSKNAQVSAPGYGVGEIVIIVIGVLGTIGAIYSTFVTPGFLH